MVTRGRNICNTLKAIRKQIADANEIEYSPEECHFKGECKGTCPKCEQDVRYLEQELRLKQIAGKVIKNLSQKGVLLVQGHIIDNDDEENPIIGAIITAKLSEKQTVSDIDGNFTIEVKQGDTITVKLIGFQDRVIKLSEMSQDKLNIVTLTGGILGEVTAGIVPDIKGTAPFIKKYKHFKKAKQEKK